MAPGEVKEVEDKKSRFRDLLSVKAVRRDWICEADQPGETLGNETHVHLLILHHNMGFCLNLMSLGMNCISIGSVIIESVGTCEHCI